MGLGYFRPSFNAVQDERIGYARRRLFSSG